LPNSPAATPGYRHPRPADPVQVKRHDLNSYPIVNILSTSAFTAEPIALHYATAKAALLTYNKGIAQEFAAHGVRVNAITPGSVITPGGTEVLQSIADAVGAPLDALTATIPLGRRGEGRDIAEAVTLLAGNRGQWITGANFMVTGGANGGQ
jgi:NAD(P)-dependent dehydrogenase (short-subunit alcohol dehydrogenase family)